MIGVRKDQRESMSCSEKVGYLANRVDGSCRVVRRLVVTHIVGVKNIRGYTHLLAHAANPRLVVDSKFAVKHDV
jgi:hypothetical protein